MSVNSSSSSNASVPPSNLYAFVSFYDEVHKCFISKVGTFNITAFAITNILVVLPLSILILYLGHQQWRQQRSGTTMSHSDIFTYHMVVADLMSVLGSTLSCCGVHTDLSQMIKVGVHLCAMNLSGQLFFHMLTCVERYLAVVHPITYLSLRNAKGIRVRNMTTGCVWLLCAAGTGFMHLEDRLPLIIVYFCFTALTLIVVSFCSISVLCVLIRPGPGEGGGDRQRVDQSKLKAFYTIMTILGVLLFRCGGNITGNFLSFSQQLGETEKCGILFSVYWFSLPSSPVLPLLFLQRARKLVCCKNNNESGQRSS